MLAAAHAPRPTREASRLVSMALPPSASPCRDNQRRMRQQKQDEETALQLKLNAEWKAILDKQEADRNRQYTELKERIAKQQRVYESNAGAEDAARMAAEEAARKRWMEKFERETREKEEARVAHRKRMQNECLRMQNEQIAAHRAEKDAARQEAIRLKGVMKEQARQEKEERLQEARDDRARALKYGARLKEQIADIVNGRANDPGSHVMTPLEARLCVSGVALLRQPRRCPPLATVGAPPQAGRRPLRALGGARGRRRRQQHANCEGRRRHRSHHRRRLWPRRRASTVRCSSRCATANTRASTPRSASVPPHP